MRIFQMPHVRSKHEKGFNSSGSLQVPKVVFVGYRDGNLSSSPPPAFFLSRIAMAATNAHISQGLSFSTSGLKTLKQKQNTKSWLA